MPWYFPWSDSIKNRAVRYLLQKYVGQFLQEKLTLDQLSVDLYNGTGTIKEVLLDVVSLNEALDEYSVPLEIVDGFIGSISVTVPWSALISDSTLVEVRNLEVTVKPRVRDEDPMEAAEMLESMFSSMTTSMELAKECLQQSEAKEQEAAQGFEGLEKFAQTIEAVLTRIKLSFVDTVIRLEHRPKDTVDGTGLEIRISRIEYFDDQAKESSPVDTTSSPKRQNVFEPAAVAHKNFQLMGLTLFCDEFSQSHKSFSRSIYKSTIMDHSREGSSVDAMAESPPLTPPAPSITQPLACPDELRVDQAVDPIKIAVFQGRQEVRLKIKQNDELPGPKLELDCQFGNMNIHLSPRQVHLLMEIVSSITTPGTAGGAKSSTVQNKPMEAQDFANIERELQKTMAADRVQDSSGRLRRESEEVLITSMESVDETFYGLQSTEVGSMESSFTSTTSHSTSTAPKYAGFSGAMYLPGSLVTKRQPLTLQQTMPKYRRHRSRRKDAMQRHLEDTSADTNRYKLRVSFFSLMLLHEDPPPTPSDGIDPAQTSTDKLHALADKYFSRIQGINPIGVGGDLTSLRQQFSEACPLDHISWLGKPLTVDCTEKLTNTAHSVSVEAVVGVTEIVEAVFDRKGATSSLYGFSLPIDNILPDYCELLTFIQDDDEKKPSVFSNMQGTVLPSLRLKFNHAEPRSKSTKRHTEMASMQLHVELGHCHTEVDISLVDRIHSLLNPQPFGADTGNGRYKSFHPTVAQSQQAVFSQAIDEDLSLGEEKKLDLTVSGRSVSLALRFPVPDLRTGQNVARLPWWRRSLRDEVLIAQLNDATFQTVLGQQDNGWKVELTCRQCHGSMLLVPNQPPVPFMWVGPAEADPSMPQERNQGFDWPRLVVKGFQQKSSLLAEQEQEEPESMAFDSLNGACKFEKPTLSPFSTRKVMYENEEMVLPGEKDEILMFQDKATSHTRLAIELTLPSVSIHLPSKDFLELLYNRVTNDLLMWEPLAPSPVNPMEQFSGPSTLLPSRLDMGTQFLTDQEQFTMCKSGLQYEDSSDSDDESMTFFSVYEPHHKARRKLQGASPSVRLPSNACVSLSVGRGRASASIQTKSEQSGAADIPQQGEMLIDIEDGSLFIVTEYAGDPELRYVCIQANKAALYHQGNVEKPVVGSTFGLLDATVPPNLHQTIYLSDPGMGTKLVEPVGQGSGSLDMVSVVVEIRGDTFRNVREGEVKRKQETKVAAGIRGASLHHQMVPFVHSWLSQVMDLLDLTDIDILGYQPPKALVELHIHFWACAILYKPLFLPIQSVLTVKSFSISSNVVPESPVSMLRFLVDDAALYLAKKTGDLSVNLRKDYVCVADLGSFELTLKTTDGKDSRFPKVDLQVSNNILHVRTCADSCRALQNLIVYLANDGDLTPPLDGSTSDDDVSLQMESSGEREEPLNPQLSESNMEEVVGQVADAMRESPSTSGHSQHNQGEKSKEVPVPTTRRPADVFFFPDESQGPVDTARVDLSSPESMEGGISLEAEQELSIAMEDSLLENEPGGDKTTQRQQSDEEFCIIDDPGLGIAPRDGEPTIKVHAADPIKVLDDYFKMPLGKTDQLRAPAHFPTPVYRYMVKEMSLVWYMYGGSDFDKPVAPKVEIKTSEGELFQQGGGVVFRKPGAKKTEKMGQLAWQARGGQHRDHDTLMELQLNKVRLQHEVYPETSTQASRQVLLISDVEIRDRLASSKINKFLYRYSSEAQPRQSTAQMLLIKALHTRPDTNLPAQECCLRVSLQPLRLNLDQDAVFFLRDFFTAISGNSKSDSSAKKLKGAQSSKGPTPAPVMTVGNAPSPGSPPDAQELLIMFDEMSDNEEEDPCSGSRSSEDDSTEQPIYFKKFLFSPDVPIRLDYHGKRVNRDHGALAGVLVGLAQLNCSELRLKRISYSRGLLGIDRLLMYAVNEWLQDIKKSQLPSILGGVGPMYSLVQLVQGLRDLFWLPVEQYRKDGRIVRGLQRGAQSFTTSTAMAALELTNRLVQSLQLVAEVAYDMVSPGPSVRMKKKKKLRRIRQPADLREGVTTAYNVVKEGITDTAETIVRVVTEEHEQKGMTGAVGGVMRQIPPTVLQPILLATEATSSVLGGMRNQLLPDRKKEEEDKWKPEDNE